MMRNLGFCLLIVGLLAFFAFRTQAAPPQSEATHDKPNNVAVQSQFEGIDNRLCSDFPYTPEWIPVMPRMSNESPDGTFELSTQEWMLISKGDFGLSKNQQSQLRDIQTRTQAEFEDHFSQLEDLRSNPGQAESLSDDKQSSLWELKLIEKFHGQIEGVLTFDQRRKLGRALFAIQAVGSINDLQTRQRIRFSDEQAARYCGIARERSRRFQEQYLNEADQTWELLNSDQQRRISSFVERQARTSPDFGSMVRHVGFDIDAWMIPYPMLAEKPVQSRLKLSTDQDKQLQAELAHLAARIRKARSGDFETGSALDDKKRLKRILTPKQLALLEMLDFRRQVVSALETRESWKAMEINNEQAEVLQNLQEETNNLLFKIESEMLGKVAALFTPDQREQLTTIFEQQQVD